MFWYCDKYITISSNSDAFAIPQVCHNIRLSLYFDLKDQTNPTVTEKLAACVNIIPGISSVYVWEGKVENDEELLMMIKTRTEVVPGSVQQSRLSS